MSERRDWQEENRVALSQALDDLRLRIEAKRAGTVAPPDANSDRVDSALERTTRKFHLTGFERDLLLLTAGVELDNRFARLVAECSSERPRAHPTFSLTLSILDSPHWSAIAPNSVLRRGRLLRLEEGVGLVDAALRIEESVLHALTGLCSIDERLRPFVTSLHSHALAPGQQEAAARIVEGWQHRNRDGERPKVILMTADSPSGISVATAACEALDFKPLALDLAGLPADRVQVEEILDLWQRDAVLHDLALILDAGTAESPDRRNTLRWTLDRLNGLVAVVAERIPAGIRSSFIRVPLADPSPQEQLQIWGVAAGPLAGRLNGHLSRIAEQFRLPSQTIWEAAEEMRTLESAEPGKLGDHAWELCRRRSRGGLEDLAQRIEVRASWDTLVLPPAQMELLRSIALQMRQRFRVYETWGFRNLSSRGLGVSTLFHGPSGAGKTYAAEVLSVDLNLDLYRIDLSSTVSKYIGETEKNLKRIFDAAEQSGAILLFDEADALFGKRSEVKDSHDRYANLEVSYLLQRIESYRGLAILTTNLKGALDQAFLRRLRFIVPFPFPSSAERERIWRSVFPAQTPLDPCIDWAKLGRLAVSGGNIANIALDAAFRAANDDVPVGMSHLLSATRAECIKIEKPLAENETRGWV